jgi:hypothetical protein
MGLTKLWIRAVDIHTNDHFRTSQDREDVAELFDSRHSPQLHTFDPIKVRVDEENMPFFPAIVDFGRLQTLQPSTKVKRLAQVDRFDLEAIDDYLDSSIFDKGRRRGSIPRSRSSSRSRLPNRLFESEVPQLAPLSLSPLSPQGFGIHLQVLLHVDFRCLRNISRLVRPVKTILNK